MAMGDGEEHAVPHVLDKNGMLGALLVVSSRATLERSSTMASTSGELVVSGTRSARLAV